MHSCKVQSHPAAHVQPAEYEEQRKRISLGLFPSALLKAQGKRRIGNAVEYATDMYDAVLNADALLLLTEWKQFRMPSWGVVKKTMNQAVLIDGRNIYEEQEMKEIGFDYMCIGK